MNNTKRIVFATLMALAPFVANATQTVVETNTPAAVGANGTVKKAASTGPYVTNEPTAADQTHIATTAYVKGAYNDAIAAVNKVDSDKQTKLVDMNNPNENVLPAVFTEFNSNKTNNGLDSMLLNSDNAGYAGFYDGVSRGIASDVLDIDKPTGTELDDMLISAGTTLNLIRGVGLQLKDGTDTVATDLANKRVKIYTTWADDRDSATTLVPFETAQ